MTLIQLSFFSSGIEILTQAYYVLSCESDMSSEGGEVSAGTVTITIPNMTEMINDLYSNEIKFDSKGDVDMLKRSFNNRSFKITTSSQPPPPPLTTMTTRSTRRNMSQDRSLKRFRSYSATKKNSPQPAPPSMSLIWPSHRRAAEWSAKTLLSYSTWSQPMRNKNSSNNKHARKQLVCNEDARRVDNNAVNSSAKMKSNCNSSSNETEAAETQNMNLQQTAAALVISRFGSLRFNQDNYIFNETEL